MMSLWVEAGGGGGGGGGGIARGPGEPLLALSSVPELLVGGGDGGDLLLEQRKSPLEIDLLEKHQ